jgi:hypothetical protein
MIKSGKRLKELELALTRDNPLMIAQAIEFLRSEQPFEGAIGLLISYYNRSGDSSIKKQIADFMNDIKDQSACREVMDEIRKEILPETLRMLISSCWQSGLDYSDFSSDFAAIFFSLKLYDSWCLVIESSVQKMTRKDKDDNQNTDKAHQRPDESQLRFALISILRQERDQDRRTFIRMKNTS